MSNKKNLIIFSLLFLLFCGFIVKFYFNWKTFLRTNIVAEHESLHYFFPPGKTLTTLGVYLAKNANLRRPIYLIWYAKLKGYSKNLQAGEYLFVGPLTPAQLLSKIKNGEVIQHEVTFIEGWDFHEIQHKLDEIKTIKHELNNLSHVELLLKLKSDRDYVEGLFFPDTYSYIYGTSDVEILKRAYTQMQEHLNSLWQQRAKDLPYQSPYEALIVASLIEKESAYVKEQPLISSVIINRLKKHMYLQIDPTVIYALGSTYQGNLTSVDMLIKNPYNTYKNKGLPPSPICMPGLMALQAALHPAESEYLYFVAKGDGTHYFSKTLTDHDIALKKYLFNKFNFYHAPKS